MIDKDQIIEAAQLRVKYDSLEDVESKLTKTLVKNLTNQVGKNRVSGSDDGWWIDDKLGTQLTKKLGLTTGAGDNFYRVGNAYQLRYDPKADKWQLLV